MIERALERFRGNRRQAADALKISTVTLWRKMKQYGLGRVVSDLPSSGCDAPFILNVVLSVRNALRTLAPTTPSSIRGSGVARRRTAGGLRFASP